ncbi:MAG: membrane lipoprotein lipid attachment site-containing protein, partial [Campylobacterota bacterium]|nr:membrane lipoprotein lipid attachment site-containing protein [Campylobacterota bacterium]
MKIIIFGILALLMLAGCSSNQPVVQPIEKKAEKKKTIKRTPASKPRENGKIPPLPEPEADVDMDSIVEQATKEVMSGDTVAATSMMDVDTDSIVEQTAKVARDGDNAATEST